MPGHFYNPNALLWLWLVPAMAGLFFFAAMKRKQAIRIFGMNGIFPGRKREAGGHCLATLLVVLALARPAWNLQEQALQESGRDVIFLLDVSRSMLAEDLHPNRLEHAKTAIIDALDEFSGDRIGLILFAGSAEIRCPLTGDYDYFRMALRQAAPDSIGAGGTMIAHAIERTLDQLIDPAKAGMQDLVLITDGEDLVEGPDEIAAAQMLDDAGVRLIAIGIGDQTRGSRIAVEDENAGSSSFMKHDQAEVWTKLHAETLRRMAASVTDGVYFDVATGPLNLARIYHEIMDRAPRTVTGDQTVKRYEEKFHLFLGTAVIVLLLTHRWKLGGANMVLCVLLTCGSVRADPVKLFEQGNKAYAERRFGSAITAYRNAASEAPESAEIHYNLGNTQYRQGAFEAAAESFERAASLTKSDALRSRSLYNLGNCMVKTGEDLRATNPGAAMAYCQQAVWLYRIALDRDPGFIDAAYNLEIAQIIGANIAAEIQQQQEKMKQQNDFILYLREKLTEFIRRQAALIDTGTIGNPQNVLEQETRELATLMQESGLHLATMLPDGTRISGPLEDTFAHTITAAEAMATADQSAAWTELVAALDAMPQDPNQQNGDPDEGSEADEDYDMDYRSTDDEADMYEEADPFGDFSEYEEIRGLPPPNQTETDILSEEIRNQDRRKKKKAGEYKPIEKDW